MTLGQGLTYALLGALLAIGVVVIIALWPSKNDGMHNDKSGDTDKSVSK